MNGSNILVAMNHFRNICIPFLLIFLLIIRATSAANDTINSTQTIRDGETLVSSGGIFELGFFSPRNSTNRYVGIWYHNISVQSLQTYVWVANRQAPLSSSSGVLRFTEQGNLTLFNHTNGVIVWSSNATRDLADPAAQLLDSGNLVVKDANDDRPENFVWQSFDYPSDTVLPTMGLGWNYVTGVESYLSSWRSSDDPGPGEFTFHVDPAGVPQVLLKRGGAVLKRMGPWNGLLFSGQANVSIGGPVYPLAIIREVVMDENEVKFRENMVNRSIIFRAVLNYEGVGQTMIWNRGMKVWDNYSFLGADDCDNYDFCGANGICNTRNSKPCGCLDRFVSRDGCTRRTPLNCRDDVFVKYPGIKMPDARNSTYTNRSMRLADCEAECSRNCSCTAYAQLDVRAEGSGCLFYHGELIDMRTMDQGGQDLYIRLASADLAADSKGNKRVILIASLTSVAGLVLVCLCLVRFCTRRRRKERDTTNYVAGPFGGNHGKEGELEFFNLPTILNATDSFSNNNKLGEGGFGPVYRGKLEDGQEIAVKRLSKSSLQGVEELKNEVVLIAKLQHRNLVRTLGFCVEGEENMLVYEYMPNFSLDLILFDRTKSMLLEWQQRFQIISGIAKGLLYLHEDSRLRIIHRDLKASNILLDARMNPKISDFGLARGFGENETEAKTGRVVGTFGYMSPEYAIDGLFSMKSDVFSFGVLVLEIVSGQRNRGFSLKDHNLNLLGHAWTLYKEDRLDKLVDPSLGNSFDLFEVLRSIHVGLLCVQKRPEDRPSMSSVVFMLGNEVELPEAKEPGFFTDRDVSQAVSSSNTTHSGNQVTMTLPVGR